MLQSEIGDEFNQRSNSIFNETADHMSTILVGFVRQKSYHPFSSTQ